MLLELGHDTLDHHEVTYSHVGPDTLVCRVAMAHR
jgi:hypothetical protein